MQNSLLPVDRWDAMRFPKIFLCDGYGSRNLNLNKNTYEIFYEVNHFDFFSSLFDEFTKITRKISIYFSTKSEEWQETTALTGNSTLTNYDVPPTIWCIDDDEERRWDDTRTAHGREHTYRRTCIRKRKRFLSFRRESMWSRRDVASTVSMTFACLWSSNDS